MRQRETRDNNIRIVLNNKKIATLDELKEVTETQSTMTIFRSLSRLRYTGSYSHRGRYYTLISIPDFDHLGLWSYQGVMFSSFGNLVETCNQFVQQAERGYTSSELASILQVEVNHALLRLTRKGNIRRKKLGTAYVYLSIDPGRRRQQKLMRSEQMMYRKIRADLDIEVLPDELKAGIILFFSLLDEQQRRLYAGLEAAKMGYGGDRMIAELLNLDPHTVAKGRRELFTGSVKREGIRNLGGGRKLVEKKLPR